MGTGIICLIFYLLLPIVLIGIISFLGQLKTYPSRVSYIINKFKVVNVQDADFHSFKKRLYQSSPP